MSDYKEKYLKYKSKYINLQKNLREYEQSGGYGYKTKHWNQHNEFVRKNTQNKSKVLLSPDNNPANTQLDDYKELLNNFFTYNAGSINFDFINDFFRYIYYDVNDTFSIEKNSGTQSSEFKNQPKVKYTLQELAVNREVGKPILFKLVDRNNSTPYVLKVFMNEEVDMNHIDDYLSLIILTSNTDYIRTISKGQTMQKNFYDLGNFDLLNFNMQQNLIKDQEDKDIYLAVRTNDAINDFIQNIILQQITDRTYKMVRYKNLFVTKVYGKYRYCIIMDKCDGSLDYYIKNELTSGLDPKIKKPDILENNGRDVETYKDYIKGCIDSLTNIYNQADALFDVVKTAEYLFTHTDMKVENLFYNKNKGKIELFLADFDKASITYRGVRFFNNYTAGGRSPLQNITSDPLTGVAKVSDSEVSIIDRYTQINKVIGAINFNKSREHVYKLSRVAGKYGYNVETEQLYMRYNYTPYYTSFDYASLLISMIVYLKHLKIDKIFTVIANNSFIECINKYIICDIQQIIGLYNGVNDTSNFANITNMILSRDPSERFELSFKHKYHTYDQNMIQKLFITYQSPKYGYSNKLCLSVVFAPSPAVVKGDITTYITNKKNTAYLYPGIDTRDIDIKLDYNIDWTAATSLFGSIGYQTEPINIVKTNRYSELGGVYVFEYDFPGKKEKYAPHIIAQIYDIMQNIPKKGTNFDKTEQKKNIRFTLSELNSVSEELKDSYIDFIISEDFKLKLIAAEYQVVKTRESRPVPVATGEEQAPPTVQSTIPPQSI